MTNEWDDCLSAVRDLIKYEPSWDEADGNAVRPELIETARRWLELLRDDGTTPPPGSIYPTSGGTVMVEWLLQSGIVIAAHIRIGGLVETITCIGSVIIESKTVTVPTNE